MVTPNQHHSPAPNLSPTAPASFAEWRSAQAEIARLIFAPTRREDVTVSAAVGRVLADPLVLTANDCAGSKLGSCALAAGTLVRWSHLPLFVAAGCRTVGVHARARAGIVTVTDRVPGMPEHCPADEATAALIGAVFEQMGGQTFMASNPEPGHRLRPLLEMFANRCELIFVVGDLGPQAWQALKPSTSRCGVSHFHIGSTLVLLLSPRLHAALVSFVAFAVPLIRRLQGRGHTLPATRLVQSTAAHLPGAGMQLVSGRFVGERFAVTPCDASLGPGGLVGATGVAWRPEDIGDVHASTLAYLPFEEWLC